MTSQELSQQAKNAAADKSTKAQKSARVKRVLNLARCIPFYLSTSRPQRDRNLKHRFWLGNLVCLVSLGGLVQNHMHVNGFVCKRRLEANPSFFFRILDILVDDHLAFINVR